MNKKVFRFATSLLYMGIGYLGSLYGVNLFFMILTSGILAILLEPYIK